MTGRCGRCATSSTAARRGAPVAAPDILAEEHLGYEIYYVPAVSGWHYRGPDASPSALSYRSAFLARKAVDEDAASSTTKASRATSADNES